MAVQTEGYSKTQQREADRLIAVADKWAEGVDRKRGVRFNIFASRSTPGAYYYTRFDGRGCTCPGARESRSGRCFHQLAVATITEQAREEFARPTLRYESIYGLEDAF